VVDPKLTPASQLAWCSWPGARNSAPHDHRTADDQVVRPILVIEGYPSEPPALHRWAPPGGVPAI
jgi:hypothetical protein